MQSQVNLALIIGELEQSQRTFFDSTSSFIDSAAPHTSCSQQSLVLEGYFAVKGLDLLFFQSNQSVHCVFLASTDMAPILSACSSSSNNSKPMFQLTQWHLRRRKSSSSLSDRWLLTVSKFVSTTQTAIEDSTNLEESVANFQVIRNILKQPISNVSLNSKAIDYLQRLTLVGIVIRKGALYPCPPSTSTSSDSSETAGSFFLLAITSITDSSSNPHHSTNTDLSTGSDVIHLIFSGAQAGLYHRYFGIGGAFIFRNLCMMTLFARKQNERRILVFKETRSSVRQLTENDVALESGTMPFELHRLLSQCLQGGLPSNNTNSAVQSSVLIDPLSLIKSTSNNANTATDMELDHVAFESGVVSYTGIITKFLDPLWRLIELDNEFQVYLVHCDAYLWNALMPGQTITLRNVHYIHYTDDGLLYEKGQVLFGYCGSSQLEIVSDTPRQCVDYGRNEGDLLSEWFVRVPLAKVLYYKSIYDDIKYGFQRNNSTLVSIFNWCLKTLGIQTDGEADRRDIYNEFFQHDVQCQFKACDYQASQFQLFTPSSIRNHRTFQKPGPQSSMVIQHQIIPSCNEQPSPTYWYIGMLTYGADGYYHIRDRNHSLPLVFVSDSVPILFESASILAIKNPKFVKETIRIDGNDLTVVEKEYLLIRDTVSLIASSSSATFYKVPEYTFTKFTRLIFVTQILRPSYRVTSDLMEKTVFGTSFKLSFDSSSRQKCHLSNVLDLLISVCDPKSLCHTSRMRTGQWYLLEIPDEILGIYDTTNAENTNRFPSQQVDSLRYFKLSDLNSKVPIRRAIIAKSCPSDTQKKAIDPTECLIVLDRISELMATQIEQQHHSFTTFSKVSTVSELLDTIESSASNAGRIPNGLLKELYSFTGQIIEKDLRQSDSVYRGSGWFQTEENWKRFGVGLGEPGRILHFKLKDCQCEDTIDLYWDNFESGYPFGLIPGSRVIVEQIALKRGLNGTVYGQAVTTSKIYPVPINDEDQMTYSAAQFTEQGRLLTKEPIHKVIEQIKEIKLLGELRPYDCETVDKTTHRQIMQKTFHCIADITRLNHIHFKYVCCKCFSVTGDDGRQCPNECFNFKGYNDHNDTTSMIQFRCEIGCLCSDGSNEVSVLVNDEHVVFTLLDLADDTTTELCAKLKQSVKSVGEVLFKDDFDWLTTESNSSNSRLLQRKEPISVREHVEFVQNLLASRFTWRRRQNLLMACKLNPRLTKATQNNFSQLPEELRHMEPELKRCGITAAYVRTVNIDQMQVETLCRARIHLIAVALYRLPLTQLATLIANKLARKS